MRPEGWVAGTTCDKAGGKSLVVTSGRLEYGRSQRRPYSLPLCLKTSRMLGGHLSRPRALPPGSLHAAPTHCFLIQRILVLPAVTSVSVLNSALLLLGLFMKQSITTA